MWRGKLCRPSKVIKKGFWASSCQSFLSLTTFLVTSYLTLCGLTCVWSFNFWRQRLLNYQSESMTYDRRERTRRMLLSGSSLCSGCHCIWSTCKSPGETVAPSACGNTGNHRRIHRPPDRPIRHLTWRSGMALTWKKYSNFQIVAF